MGKITKEKFKTYKNVFDNHAERCLFKLSSQGHFDELIGPIALGKEANVFSAIKDEHKVIVKIYRLENCDFNKMYDYIKFDPRYLHLKKNRRLIIFSWCKREYRNLMKAREAGVKTPQPIAFLDNVLVMEYIGRDYPAPQVKDSMPKDPKTFMDKVIKNMQNLTKAGLVHGDLSSFNILNHEEKPVFIDFSQCTPLNSMNSGELITRDSTNMSKMASKMGIELSISDIKEKIKKK